MRTELPIADDVSLVLTRDEHGYQEVLDAFRSATRVSIVTYNISARDRRLLDRLRALSPNVDVRIVTNVPNRYGRYYGDLPRTRARQTIRAYLDRLNPATFDAQVQTFFRFDNHCKLVATDSIAYVGSANFSDESAGNLEAGILIRNPERAREVSDLIFAEAEAGAAEHGNNPVATAVIQLSAAKAMADAALRECHDLFYTETDPDYVRSIEYFNWDACPADRNDLDVMADRMNDIEGVLSDIGDDEIEGGTAIRAIVDAVETKPFDVLRECVNVDGPLDSFVTHDPESFVMDQVAEAIYDNYDAACDSATDDEITARRDLADVAEPEVRRIEEVLRTVSAGLTQAIVNVRKLRLATLAVDNT